MAERHLSAVPPRWRARLPRLGDGVTERINLLEAMAELASVAVARARFLGELLEAQWLAAEGEPGAGLDGPPESSGLVGYTYAAEVVGSGAGATLERSVTGEQIRALVVLEAAERDRAARLIDTCLKIGVALHTTEVVRSYAGSVAAALQAMVAELGLSLDDVPVLRAAQRAGLAARKALGQDDGDPDVQVGPALSAAERVRALSAALAVAEAELQAQT